MVEPVEPTASEPVSAESWKTQRNATVDFFTSLAGFVEKQVGEGVEISLEGVTPAHDKWQSAWEAAQDATYEEFMSAFWSNPENVAMLSKTEAQPAPDMPPMPEAMPEPAAAAVVSGLLSRARGGSMVGDRRVAELERQVAQLTGRVAVVDSEAMVEQKLGASGLPPEAKTVIRRELAGRTISAAAVDGMIRSYSQTLNTVEAELKDKAAVDLRGNATAKAVDPTDALRQILKV